MAILDYKHGDHLENYTLYDMNNIIQENIVFQNFYETQA